MSVAGGECHSLVLTDRGDAYSFGAGGEGRLGHGDLDEAMEPRRIASFGARRVASVAAGADHSLALVDGGSVYSFGSGASGKLGHGDAHFQWLPRKVEALACERAVAVAAGESHSLCVLRDGRVFGWGSGGVGLGLQLAEHRSAPLGSAGNEYHPAAGLLSRQTHLPLPYRYPLGAAGSAWPAWA